MDLPKCKICGEKHRLGPCPSTRTASAPKHGLAIKAKVARATTPADDGVALMSIAHPLGLIDKIADAIKDGRLALVRTPKKKRAPRGTFDRTAYQRELMRKRRQKEAKK